MSSQSTRGRGRIAPIDAHAVDLASAKLLPARLERDAQKIVDSACNLTRLKIIRALAETPLPASDLARVVGRPATATSQHIRVLRDLGAVAPQRSGNVVRYRLTNEPSARILEAIARSLDLLRDR
jgi:DNA-binding transcriptional ArsR family regulator